MCQEKGTINPKSGWEYLGEAHIFWVQEYIISKFQMVLVLHYINKLELLDEPDHAGLLGKQLDTLLVVQAFGKFLLLSYQLAVKRCKVPHSTDY